MSSTASAPTERRGARSGSRTRRRHPEGLDRLRILLAGAMGAILVGYALLVPVALLLLASGASGSLDASFAIAVPMWLAAHQIPVEVEGRALGVLPLLPTAVVVVVVAVAAGWSARRMGGRIRHDGGPVVAGQAGAAAAVAVLAGALLPGDVSVTTPWASMVGAGLLAGLAAGAGVLRVCGLPPEWTRALVGWPRAALAGARAAAAGLLLSGTVVVLLGLAVRAGAVADSFAGLAPGAGASAGVLLLAVGYLPNTVVAGVAWSLGPGFSIGAAQYGPFGTQAGPVPPFPLFAAVPAEQAPGWAAVVLLLPVGAGVVAGLVCRRSLGASAPLPERAAAAASAACATAAGAAIVAAVAGGSLAGGPYDPVSLSPFGVLATALVLLGVPATIAAVGVDELLGRPPAARRPARDRTRPAARRESRPHGERSARTGRPGHDGAGRGGSRTARDASTGDASTREEKDRAKRGRKQDGGKDDGRKQDDREQDDREQDDRDAGRDGASGDRAGAARGGSSRAGRSRDASRGSGSGSGGDRGGGGRGPSGRSERDRPSRPRTVADLVAQQSRETDDPAASRDTPRDGPDADGTGGDPAGR